MGNKKKTPISHRPKSKLVGYSMEWHQHQKRLGETKSTRATIVIFFCDVVVVVETTNTTEIRDNAGMSSCCETLSHHLSQRFLYDAGSGFTVVKCFCLTARCAKRSNGTEKKLLCALSLQRMLIAIRPLNSNGMLDIAFAFPEKLFP